MEYRINVKDVKSSIHDFLERIDETVDKLNKNRQKLKLSGKSVRKYDIAIQRLSDIAHGFLQLDEDLDIYPNLTYEEENELAEMRASLYGEILGTDYTNRSYSTWNRHAEKLAFYYFDEDTPAS